jgi:hypothetical protein
MTTNMNELLPENAMYEPFWQMVRPQENWKNPIDASIKAPRSEGDYKLFCSMIEQAIMFYSGSVPTIEKISIDSKGWPTIRVTAVGYYAAIGA